MEGAKQVRQDLEIKTEKKTQDLVLQIHGRKCFAVWAETWTLTNKMCRRLVGIYTRMLTAVFGFPWRDRITNDDPYGKLSKITSVLKAKRLRSIGHM